MRLWRAAFFLAHLAVVAAAALGQAEALPAVARAWLSLSGGAPRPRASEDVRLRLELEGPEGRRPIPPSWQKAALGQARTRMALARHARDPDPLPTDQLGTWLARRAAADFPSAAYLHLRLEPSSQPALRFSLDKQR